MLIHIKRFFSDLYWFFQYRFNPRHRYHMISARNPEYKFGYLDKPELMFNACFNLLKDYVEKERPFEIIDWDSDPESKRIGQEIKDLYHWWTVTRWENQKKCEEIYEMTDDLSWEDIGSGLHQLIPDKSDIHHAWITYHNDLEKQDEEMFERLAKIRRSLWT